MECNAVHSVVERKLKNKEIYQFSEFVRLTKKARKHPNPYEAKLLSHKQFLDFKNHQHYKFIHSGRTKGDLEVKDLRYLNMIPNYVIFNTSYHLMMIINTCHNEN